MSFGFGVGDLLAVIKTANDIRKDFSGAPEQLQNIASDVRNLAGVLQDVDTYLAGHEISSSQEDTLAGMENGCNKVLKDIQKFVSKYSTLESSQSGTRERIKRVWQRARWDPAETRELRQRLTSNLVALNAFTASVTSGNLIKLVSRQKEQEDDEILEWLSPGEVFSQHSDHLRNFIPGTGQWLYGSPQYKKWLQAKGEILFLHGIPGSGKTMISSMIIDSLQKLTHTDHTIAMCYFYCDYKRQSEQQMDDLMLRFLGQLARTAAAIPSEIRHLYDLHRKSRTRPTLQDLKFAFASITKSFSMVYIVIDALDECQETNNCRNDLIDNLIEMHESGSVNILVTSRPNPNIQSKLAISESIEVRATSDDIGRYIRDNLKNLPSFVAKSTELQQEIISTVTANVDGMFLLAKLYVDSLKGKRSATQLRRRLASVSSGSNSYKEAYTKTMEGLRGQGQERYELAIEVLSWVAFARRPLTSNELLHALATEIDASEFDEDNIPDLGDAVSACGGLVVIETDSDLVRLTHYTAHEFFDSDEGRPWLEDAQTMIASKCVAYLSFDTLSSGICKHKNDYDERLRNYAFYSYSSCYWGFHITSCGAWDLARELMSKENQFQASSQVLQNNICNIYVGTDVHFSTYGATPMPTSPLIAYFGMEDVVKDFLPNKDIESSDARQRTALSHAAAAGNDSLLQLLLDHGAQVRTADFYGHTPLIRAAQNGHAKTISVLLQPKPDTIAKEMIAAFSWAAANGHTAAVQALLENGADINSSMHDGMTALAHAARSGHTSIVALLLERGAKVDLAQTGGRTALMHAAAGGHVATVKLLVEHKADINKRCNFNRTALICAARFALDKNAAAYLLDHGADITAVDQEGNTSLLYATREGHVDTVCLLLDKGADVQAKNKQGWTALICAAEGGNVDNARLLLDRGADILATTDTGKTALDAAIKANRLEIKNMLLEAYRLRNIDIGDKDGKGKHEVQASSHKMAVC